MPNFMRKEPGGDLWRVVSEGWRREGRECLSGCTVERYSTGTVEKKRRRGNFISHGSFAPLFLPPMYHVRIERDHFTFSFKRQEHYARINGCMANPNHVCNRFQCDLLNKATCVRRKKALVNVRNFLLEYCFF